MKKKRCKRCDELLPMSAYFRDRSVPDGRQRRCKECVEDRYRGKEPKKIAALLRAWGEGSSVNCCKQMILVSGEEIRCDLDAGHKGMCGFIFDKGSAHWIDRRLSDEELLKLSEGIFPDEN